jgi:PAS domain S-box-containing protein
MRDTSQQLIQDRIRDLRENTDFVNALLESLVGYAIIAADFDGNIIAFNEGARQIYGYAPEEIISKQSIEIFFPKDFIQTGKLQKATADLIERGRFSYDGDQIKKSGESFPAQILFTLTKDRSGKVIGFVEVVADLTERKRVEEMEAEALANAARIEQMERELQSLERLSQGPQTTITAQTLGIMPLRQSAPDAFNRLVQHYNDLLDLALEQRAYKVEHNISEGLHSMTDQMGFLNVGPRDVVEIHSTALKKKSNGTTPQKFQAYVEEGRLMVLELMGYLTSFYRNYLTGAVRPSALETAGVKAGNKQHWRVNAKHE